MQSCLLPHDAPDAGGVVAGIISFRCVEVLVWGIAAVAGACFVQFVVNTPRDVIGKSSKPTHTRVSIPLSLKLQLTTNDLRSMLAPEAAKCLAKGVKNDKLSQEQKILLGVALLEGTRIQVRDFFCPEFHVRLLTRQQQQWRHEYVPGILYY